jgi:hypothetical protein
VKRGDVNMGRWLKNIFLAVMGRKRDYFSGPHKTSCLFSTACMLEESKRVFFLEPGLDIEKCLPVPKMKPVHPKNPKF